MWVNLNHAYLYNLDAYKYGDSARQLLKGEGFSTLMPLPSQAPSHADDGTFARRTNKPLWVATLAGFFALFGDSEDNIMRCGALFYLPLVFLTFLLGRRLFGSVIGFIAALLVAASPYILRTAINGGTESMFNCLLLAHFYFLTDIGDPKKVQGRRGLGWALLFLILAIYVRAHSFVLLVPFWLVLAYDAKQAERRRLLPWVLVSLLAIVPLFWWSQKNYGSPLRFHATQQYSLSDTLRSQTIGSEATQSMRAMDDQPTYDLGDLLTHADLLVTTYWRQVKFYLQQLPYFPHPLIAAAFFLSLFALQLGPSGRRLRKLVLCYAAITALSAAFTVPVMRYYIFCVPFMALMATTLACKLYRDAAVKGWGGDAVVALLALFIGLSMVQTLNYEPKKSEADLFKSKVAQLVDANCPHDAVLVSDVPAIVAWKNRRLTFLVPQSLRHLELLKRRQRVDYLLITLNEFIQDDEQEWRQLFYQPRDYPELTPALTLIAKSEDAATRKRFAVLYKVDN